MFQKVDIPSLNFFKNFEFFGGKTINILSFWKSNTEFPENRIPAKFRWNGVKMEVLNFLHIFGSNILCLYLEKNPPKTKLLSKNTLVATYSVE